MEKFFRLKENETTVVREFVAGVTIFLAMAPILTVVPGLLGGAPGGPSSAEVYTATLLAAAVGTLIMGFCSNLPVALGPNVGLSAFFVDVLFGVVGLNLSWAELMGAVLIQGVLFVIISLPFIRKVIVDAVPLNLKKAVTVGIGLQVAMKGLLSSGVIVWDDALSQMGSFTSTDALVAIIGLLVTIVLYSKYVPGAIFLGIVITAVVRTAFGGFNLPEDFVPVSMPAAPLFVAPEFSFTWEFVAVVAAFLFVDVFQTLGSFLGITAQAGIIKNKSITVNAGKEEVGDIPKTLPAFLASALGSIAAALLGTAPVSVRVESVAGSGTGRGMDRGKGVGGRTGLAAVVTSLFFLIALFLRPLVLLIPSPALTPALVLVGLLLMWKVTEIEFTYPTEAIPAFLTILLTSFTSIVEGIIYGVLSFVLCKILTGKAKYIPTATWILSVIFILRFFIH
ncbi:MAG: NCS2 family permease [Spirochaetaceae bacterium]|jgi:AGZA family xanthine/uracil permease-like MFS transporter|nr:NCS2 family permease [Spirochaetaceae bacterium]